MEELKAKATELGLDFKGNISRADLIKMIEDAENPTAEGSSNNRIKVKITPRDPEEKSGYVGLNNYSAQFKFDEEIEMPKDVVEFIKSLGGYVYVNGERKWQSRYFVEKID